MASQEPAWSTAIEDTARSPALGLRSVSVNALSSSGWTSLLSALKASVSGIDAVGAEGGQRAEARVALGGDARPASRSRPPGRAAQPHAQVSASGWPALTRP